MRYKVDEKQSGIDITVADVKNGIKGARLEFIWN